MKTKWKTALLIVAVAAALFATGCRKRTRTRNVTERQSDGIVAILTGDPDDEVNDETEDFVYDAVQNGPNDAPVDR